MPVHRKRTLHKEREANSYRLRIRPSFLFLHAVDSMDAPRGDKPRLVEKKWGKRKLFVEYFPCFTHAAHGIMPFGMEISYCYIQPKF